MKSTSSANKKISSAVSTGSKGSVATKSKMVSATVLNKNPVASKVKK
jgi:hypothetical protein